MKKKLIAALMTATMVTGVMSGCGSNAGVIRRHLRMQMVQQKFLFGYMRRIVRRDSFTRNLLMISTLSTKANIMQH